MLRKCIPITEYQHLSMLGPQRDTSGTIAQSRVDSLDGVVDSLGRVVDSLDGIVDSLGS